VASAENLRRLALALPETYEDLHRRRPAFRVDKRIFAMLGVTGNESLFTSLGWDTVAVVKLHREDQLNLAAGFPDAIQPTETYGHHGWTYLRLDEDGDYVVRSTPCPFLGQDNYCSIYEVRPSDCERFPYTDEDVLIKRPAITQKNTTFCPIVYFVLEKLMAAIP